MNWDALGAIGEVVGALAVFGTLVYLALQIRIQNQQLKIQNKQAELQHAETRLASNQQYIKSMADTTVSVAHNPELTKLIYAMQDSNEWDKLDHVSMMRVYLIMYANLKVWEGAYFQYQEKQLDDSFWQSIERSQATNTEAPAFVEYWATRSTLYSDEFGQYIDNLLKTQTSPKLSKAE